MSLSDELEVVKPMPLDIFKTNKATSNPQTALEILPVFNVCKIKLSGLYVFPVLLM